MSENGKHSILCQCNTHDKSRTYIHIQHSTQWPTYWAFSVRIVEHTQHRNRIIFISLLISNLNYSEYFKMRIRSAYDYKISHSTSNEMFFFSFFFTDCHCQKKSMNATDFPSSDSFSCSFVVFFFYFFLFLLPLELSFSLLLLAINFCALFFFPCEWSVSDKITCAHDFDVECKGNVHRTYELIQLIFIETNKLNEMRWRPVLFFFLLFNHFKY